MIYRATAAPERPFGNHFSFSHSAWSKFRTCPRSWWISKVLFWRGWERHRAPPLHRLAYGLTKMSTVWSLAGTIVHEIAADEASGRRQRSLDAALSYLDYRMRRGWKESQEGGWAERPKEVVNLFELYYRHPDAARLFALARDRAERSVRALYGSEALALIRRGEVLAVEVLEQMLVGDVGAWVQLDVAVRADDLTWLVDWKTGKPRPADDRSQALLYVLYYHDVLGVPAEEIRVLLVYLLERRHEILRPQPAEIDAVRRLVVQRANEIRSLLDPPGHTNRADKQRFPPVDRPEICRRCELHHACKGTRALPL